MVGAGSAMFGSEGPQVAFRQMQQAADGGVALTDNDAISA